MLDKFSYRKREREEGLEGSGGMEEKRRRRDEVEERANDQAPRGGDAPRFAFAPLPPPWISA
jgi:hypothetical protein